MTNWTNRMKPKSHRPPFVRNDRVSIRCSTSKGLLQGLARVVKQLRLEPCGASGDYQPSYLIEMDDGALKIVPHESMVAKS